MAVCEQQTPPAIVLPKGWQWPNILAVDAAIIAVLWQQWLNRTGTIPALVLGLSVWLIYTADRLLDAQKLSDNQLLTARHRFAHRWQKPLFLVWLIVLLIDISLAVTGLTPEQFLSGAVLLGLGVGYTLAVYHRRRIPKELLVALIFALGTRVFLIGPFPNPALFTATLGLFLLAFANCVFIAYREMTLDRQMQHPSLARQHPRSRTWAFIGLAVACALGLTLATTVSTHYLMLSISSIALILLGYYAHQFPAELFRVLADAVLLIPGLSLLL